MQAAAVESPPRSPLRPPLKWAGGKRWLVPILKPLWESHRDRRLVEPLCGGLAVSLGLMPERALLNDVNPHTINFFTWLQRGFDIEGEIVNDADLYYAHRASFTRLVAPAGESKSAEGQGSKRAAELFYYLNRTGYNGLC